MAPRLEVTSARKQFPGVLALDGVSLSLQAGEVLAVVGENGAGKSTLMKIVAGVYQPDGGEVRLDGVPVRFATPREAIAAGVSLIHQEFNLAENLTVTDNLFLGRELTRGRGVHVLRRGAMARKAAELLARVGLPVERAARRVESLAPGEKQLVEIARALGMDVRVLIMDEPTSSLTQSETETLYGVIESLRKTGGYSICISHRLAEVKRCADRVVVLRDGRNAGERSKAEITHDNMVRLMVGRDLRQFYPKVHRTGSGVKTVLAISGLRYHGGPSPCFAETPAGRVRNGRPRRCRSNGTGRGGLRRPPGLRRRVALNGADSNLHARRHRRRVLSCRRIEGSMARAPLERRLQPQSS